MPGRPDRPKDGAPFHNPFASLRALRKTEQAGDVPAPTGPPASEPARVVPPAPATKAGVPAVPRAVVRMERSGRGGKEVTVIDQLDVRNREEWLKALKSALGCGGTIEGDRLVLQGDHRERLRSILAAQGVRKITIG